MLLDIRFDQVFTLVGTIIDSSKRVPWGVGSDSVSKSRRND